MTALRKRTAGLIVCVGGIALSGTIENSPVRAERLAERFAGYAHASGKREHAPQSLPADTAHQNAKSYRLHGLGPDPQSSVSPEKFGIGVLLTFLAALLAGVLSTQSFARPSLAGATTRLQGFATALAGIATLLMAATGAVISIGPAGPQAAFAASAHLPLAVLFAISLVLMLASRKGRMTSPFALAATAAIVVTGPCLAMPLVFTGPNGQATAAVLHLLGGTGLTALIAGRMLSRLVSRGAACPRIMPKVPG